MLPLGRTADGNAMYMEQPEGFIASGNEKKVCRLIKCNYGLKQASSLEYQVQRIPTEIWSHPQLSRPLCVPASTLRPWNVPSTSLDPTVVKSKVDGNSPSHGCTFLDVVVTSEIYFKATSHLDIHAT